MNVIACHATEKNWAVAIIFKPAEAGKVLKAHFEVARVSPEGVCMTAHRTATEKEARKLANEFWMKEMGRGPKMIGCGPGAM